MKKALCFISFIVCMFFASVCSDPATDIKNDLENKVAQGDAQAQYNLEFMYELGVYP